MAWRRVRPAGLTPPSAVAVVVVAATATTTIAVMNCPDEVWRTLTIFLCFSLISYGDTHRCVVRTVDEVMMKLIHK